MGYIDFLIPLFMTLIGFFAALVLAFYVIWPKIENHLFKFNSVMERKECTKEKMQLRFGAYERLILLVHRISPAQVMLRNHKANLSVLEFRQQLIADIANEYQHNFTQQLYVSDVAWVLIKDLKESTENLFRNASLGLSDATPIDDYVAIVLNHLSGLDVNPYEAAQIILKKELSAQ